MSIRSLTSAVLLVAAGLVLAGPALAADSDGPLAQERGKTRPLIIIVSSKADPTLVSVKKALEEPANREAFAQRNMVLFTVVNTIGERDNKTLDAQSTMALIRELKLNAGDKTKVILKGKDGETKLKKDENVDLKEIFATIDQMPMREKEAAASAATAAPEAPAEKAPKAAGKGAPAALDD